MTKIDTANKHIIDIPKGTYIRNIEINDETLQVNFLEKKKVALVFICLNDRYWPYLGQVISGCRKNFLPHHNVEYFAWTDYTQENKKKKLDTMDSLFLSWKDAKDSEKQGVLNDILSIFAGVVRLYETFYPNEVLSVVNTLKEMGILFKRDGSRFWIESTRPIQETDVRTFCEATKGILDFSYTQMDSVMGGVNIIETEPIEWPAPTLMRYHLFLNEEEILRNYDYVFYLDADMKVVDKISDEILGSGLTAAEHPMYSLRKEYIPPYEPNPDSTAYIKRPGKIIVDENGQKRFKPLYYAGGFQGGPAEQFIEAMKTMKKNIDKDFDNNYTAIWNDESHWNKYLSENEPEIVLSPSYIYPDSLIDEYYLKVWGKKYDPKIITITKPFTLSSQGAEEIHKFIKQ